MSEVGRKDGEVSEITTYQTCLLLYMEESHLFLKLGIKEQLSFSYGAKRATSGGIRFIDEAHYSQIPYL